MNMAEESTLLRIYIGESDRSGHQPLYEAIVEKARENHLAGATAIRGSLGFGKSSRIHTAKILRLSMDLPIIIEIIDTEQKIAEFLPVLKGMMTGGLITTQPIKVQHYEAGPELETPPV